MQLNKEGINQRLEIGQIQQLKATQIYHAQIYPQKQTHQSLSELKQGFSQSILERKQQSQCFSIHQFKLKWLGIGYSLHQSGPYQYVYRPMNNQGDKINKKTSIDGIQIVPIIQYKSHKEIVFIANFRPAIGRFVIQFPAGMTEGQDMLQNAKRQLQQQAGLVAYKFYEMPFPIIYADPNKGNQSGITYIALINGEDPASFAPFKREDTQNIRCYSLRFDKKNGICQELQKFSLQNDYVYDAKTWLVFMGVDMVEKLKAENLNILAHS